MSLRSLRSKTSDEAALPDTVAGNASLRSAPPRDIVIIKPSSLGDVVHTLPAVAFLKRQWPMSRIRWIINPEWAPLLDGNPHVDETIIFPRRDFRGLRNALKLAPWARAIRERVNADLVLDFQGLLRSALIARLCRSQDGQIVGLSDAREGSRIFYDTVADVTGRTHAVDRYLALISALGIDLHSDVPLSWPLPAGTAPAAVALPQRFVLLHPFSRGKRKSLSDEDVATFCRALAPFPVVVAGNAAQAAPSADHVIDLLNQTSLHELIWLIRRAAFVVSVDSGPMHIAAALTPHLVSIHTWSDPAKVGPFRREAWVWKGGRLSTRTGGADAAIEAQDITAVAAFVQGRVAQ